jgi:hypothetical protein
MTEEILKKIVESLYEGTKAGALVWTLNSSIFNSDTRHQMICLSSDKKTEFKLDINLDDQQNLKLGSYLYIRNDKIVDGMKSVTKVSTLEKLVFDKFLKPNLKPKVDTDAVFNDILNSIGSKEYIRDKKLEQILGKEEKKSW